MLITVCQTNTTGPECTEASGLYASQGESLVPERSYFGSECSSCPQQCQTTFGNVGYKALRQQKVVRYLR
ncbi:hypothetical protein BDV97DRAFT_348927 [Delphinella strobiligena]|nr:hypothetical protein BDV97DRAFT_348927 [Delphinella strobiligena]